MEILKTLIIVIFYLINFSKELELNAFAYTVDFNGIGFKLYVDGFNEYAKDNNLDIHINLNLMTHNNSTISIQNSSLMVESLLKKKKNKYDIYFFDNTYTRQYCSYLLDLNVRLPKEHIEMYDKNILSQVCRCEDKLVAFPFTLGFNGLFSNKRLLKKYNKKIPKTWDELIETGKEILEKERALNNTDLIGYNGYIYVDNGICSIYEFLYSCRESYESPFPELNSETTINAMKKLKQIKNELSSVDILFNGLALARPYDIKNIIVDEGENFQICPVNNLLIKLSIIVMITFKCIIIIIISILIFMEWNIKSTFYDVRFILASIYVNIISFITFIILNFVTIKSYKLYFSMQICVILTISIVNYIILFGIRLILPMLIKTDETNEIIGKLKFLSSQLKKSDSQSCDTTTNNTFNSKKTESTSNANSIYTKIIDYHYRLI
ncbi:hypothetical protein BCR32DRAFT_240855 [Anaeromyces robustus]|uniref:Periplasmic binding protein-like II n=1 Tax=Anaeromyces robustus TaxID=1754192 RepID=A0A1Y1XM47_9FUNG|nr:hypothetical protein BCR32DRAFT_240855 [Anaeromyces robustus]|eukprot:ORX86586.1 hypothetical protein BCR32DRAFT_240855 [Anaeromyces robustus]